MQMKNIAALGALCAMAGVVGAAQAETVTVNGSTTVLPAMQLVAEGFMKANPNVTITISGTGSGNGIKALMDNTTDIAMSSRDLKRRKPTTSPRPVTSPFASRSRMTPSSRSSTTRTR